MTPISSLGSPRERAVACALFLLGIILFAVVVAAVNVPVDLLDGGPVLQGLFVFSAMYSFFWALFVAAFLVDRLVAAETRWIRQVSWVGCVGVVLVVVEQERHSRSIERQAEQVKQHGMPEAFEISPSSDDVVGGKNCWFCEAGERTRILSWEDAWGSVERMVYLDPVTGRPSGGRTWYRDRWISPAKGLRVLLFAIALVVIGHGSRALSERSRSASTVDDSSTGEHA